MPIASALYAFVARARRRAWNRPGRRRRLQHPVISVGNLRVGGSGKTPTVAHIARMLLDMGEHPAILSRGYARRQPSEGAVVVSDGAQVRAGLDRAGDEPLMLARSVAGAIVVVSPDRYLGGRLAELRLGATVHVLDDGFQHLPLARDVDLLIVSVDDVRDGRVLPSGRLREPLDAARHADAVLVPDATEAEAREMGDRLGVGRVFTLTRNAGEARWVENPRDDPEEVVRGASVFAVAGVARPERFFDDVRLAGFTVAGTRAFRDHHPFAMRDVQAIAEAARQAGAGAIVTTEKDLMRLLPFQPFPMPLAWIPLETWIEPQDSFREWLQSRLRGAARASAVGAHAEALAGGAGGVAGIGRAG